MANLSGTDFNDMLTGPWKADTIRGAGGDDTLSGLGARAFSTAAKMQTGSTVVRAAIW